MMGDGGYTPKFIELAGDAAEGAYASLPGVPLDKMPGGTRFSRRYRSQVHQPIQLYAPYCYDAVNVMIAAMQKAGSADPAKYLPALGKIRLRRRDRENHSSMKRATSRVAPLPCIRCSRQVAAVADDGRSARGQAH